MTLERTEEPGRIERDGLSGFQSPRTRDDLSLDSKVPRLSVGLGEERAIQQSNLY